MNRLLTTEDTEVTENQDAGKDVDGYEESRSGSPRKDACKR